MDKLAHFQNALAERRVPALAELRARPVLNEAGRPHVVAGNNALVAHLKRADGSDVALRIVASSGKDRDWAVRYSALADFQESQSRSRLPSAIRLVRHGLPVLDPGFDGDGIETIGVAMEWIKGPTLIQGVDRAVRTGNVAVIRALSAAFVQLWNDLQTSAFVHGDYSAQNLLVRSNGQLAVVDLDGASWRDAPLGPTGEGTPGYRHPTLHRDAALRDVYAALVIVTSLAALADDPGLRARHGDPLNKIDGALLFSAWDLSDPLTSPVFADATNTASNVTRVLLASLASASIGTSQDIYDACESIPRLQMPSSTVILPEVGAIWDVAPVVARMRAHYSDTWQVEPEGNETAPALREVETTAPTPPPEWSTWELPDETIFDSVSAEDIAELKTALARNDEAEVARIWSQIERDPIARLLAIEVESMLAGGYERRVIAESRRKRDGAVVAVAMEANSRHIPLGQQARSIVRQARERIEVRARLDAALVGGDRQQLADLAMSGQLVVLGDADRSSLQHVLQAIEWPALQRAIQTDDDVLIAAAFDEELFEGSTLLDPGVRERIELARSRVQWLTRIREALAKRSAVRLRELLVDPPAGGPERLSVPERRRVRRSIEQHQALGQLDSAIKSADDQAIVSSLNRVERVGARVPDRTTWLEIQRVVERVAIIDDLLEASETRPLDYARIAQLLPAIRALGLERDPRLGDEHLVERLQEHVVRMAHVRRIQAAIARDNDVAIFAAAVPDPRNALELLSEAERNRVATAIRSRRRENQPQA